VLGVVAGVVLEVVVVGGVLVVVVWDWVVVVGAVALVVVVDVVGVVAAWVLVLWWQSRWASSATVDAPWNRLLRSVTFTVAGSAFTATFSPRAASDAAAQLPEASAEEIRVSWLDSVLDWSDESSPEPPPHAAMRSETANPRPPARMARRRERIRRRTLEAPTVDVPLAACEAGYWPYCSRSASESGSRAARIAAAAPSMS
jgi:hypothetical protein